MSITLKLDYLASRNYEDREFDPYYCPSMKYKYLEYEDSTYRKHILYIRHRFDRESI